MNFGKIIRSIQSAAWRKLKELCLRFFSKPRKSENQNPPKDLPLEETAETADLPKQPQESQTQVPIQDDDENIKSDEPNESKHERAGQTSKEPPPAPQVPAETPEQPSQKETDSSESSGDVKKKRSKPGLDREKRGEDKSKQTAKDGNRTTESQPPRCRFICYEETDGRWAVALAVEADQDVQSVRQGNKELSANGCRYIVEDIGAKVTVEFKGEHSPKPLKILNEHKFAVFKMRKNWKGEGQKVKTLSSGDYVVFAHKSCGKRIGKPPIEPEQCRYPNFTVHFFSVSENSEMNDGFENCSLPSPTKRFSLKGHSFPDDSDLGELFGDDAPQLVDAEKGREVSWIVVGRENRGKEIDRFRPEEKKMLAEVLGERSGWFFVRIYDAKVDLLHSFDFRRAKGLKNIFVDNQPLGEVAPIVSTKNGHTETIVQFDIERDLLVRPADDSNGICKAEEKENAFAVSPPHLKPHPDNDETKWVLESGEDCVKAEILLPRIWWKLIEEKGKKEGDWQATPIEMERKAFCRAGNEKIRIRFSFRIPEIIVGFGDLNSPDNPTFRTQLSKDRKICEAEFRLVYFADYQAIEKPLRKAMDLCIKLKVKDSDVVFPIVHIPADAPPPDPSPPPKPPKPSKPKSDVDKGFSLVELKRAKEELDQEFEEKAKAALHRGLMTNKEAEALLKNLPNYTVIIQPESDLRIISIRVVGGKPHQISLNRHRESMQANREKVEKLKAFFKKHFGKE